MFQDQDRGATQLKSVVSMVLMVDVEPRKTLEPIMVMVVVVLRVLWVFLNLLKSLLSATWTVNQRTEQPISDQSPLCFPVVATSPETHNMADLTREQLRAALRATGEEPPAAWTKMELRFRLQEITGEDLSRSYKKLSQGPPSEYQEWLRLLKQAKARKATLQQFVGERLKLTNVDRMTMAQLEIHALRKIYEISKPHPSDPMGFGKYSTKTYLEVLQEDQGYCNWIRKTAAKGQKTCDLHLLRFNQWLEITDKEEMIPEDKPITRLRVPPHVPKAPTKKDMPTTPASSSTSPGPTSLENKMDAMLTMMENLKGEVDKIKEEQKPRKKGAKNRDSESEASSFQMVMQTED